MADKCLNCGEKIDADHVNLHGSRCRDCYIELRLVQQGVEFNGLNRAVKEYADRSFAFNVIAWASLAGLILTVLWRVW